MIKKYKYVVEIECVDKDACGNAISPPSDYEVRNAIVKVVDYAESVSVTSEWPFCNYSDVKLTQEEFEAEHKDNAEANWGFNCETLCDQIERFNNGDERVKARVVYRLEDANFHTVANLLDNGNVRAAFKWAAENMM